MEAKQVVRKSQPLPTDNCEVRNKGFSGSPWRKVKVTAVGENSFLGKLASNPFETHFTSDMYEWR